MRTGDGAEPAEYRRDGKAGTNGLHSVDGRGGPGGSDAPPQDPGAGAGRADRGNARDVTKASWFDPVDPHNKTTEADNSISDCPEGVCSVPWLIKEEPPVVQEDAVNHPPHYTGGGIEAIEAIEAQLNEEEFRGYLKGNIAKYVWREKYKGGTESLKKAQWYLNRLIAFGESQKG